MTLRRIGVLAIAMVFGLATGCGSSTGTAGSSTSTTSNAPAAGSSSDAQTSTSGSTEATGSSSAEDSSSAPTSDTSSSSPRTTIGDKSGTLDEQSTKWFDTFCSGLAPLTQLGSSLPAIAKGSPTKETAGKLSQAGKQLTDTAASLKTLPPPTFAGGDLAASKVIEAFDQGGALLTDTSTKLAKGDTSALTALPGKLSALGKNFDFPTTPETDKAIEKIPSCQQIAGGGSSSSAPSS